MSSETNAVPDQHDQRENIEHPYRGVPPRRESSLLDQIHAARTVAESRGQHEFARWLTAHADEPCPAAIAQFMEMGEMSCSFCANTRRDVRLMIAGHSTYICDECVRSSAEIDKLFAAISRASSRSRRKELEGLK